MAGMATIGISVSRAGQEEVLLATNATTAARHYRGGGAFFVLINLVDTLIVQLKNHLVGAGNLDFIVYEVFADVLAGFPAIFHRWRAAGVLESRRANRLPNPDGRRRWRVHSPAGVILGVVGMALQGNAQILMA